MHVGNAAVVHVSILFYMVCYVVVPCCICIAYFILILPTFTFSNKVKVHRNNPLKNGSGSNKKKQGVGEGAFPNLFNVPQSLKVSRFPGKSSQAEQMVCNSQIFVVWAFVAKVQAIPLTLGSLFSDCRN